MPRTEKLRLIQMGASRIPTMAEEAKWAFGIPHVSSGPRPPAFLRSLIFAALGGAARTAPSSGDLAHFRSLVGAAKGLASGTRVLLAQPVADAEMPIENLTELAKLAEQLAKCAGPHLDEAEEVLALVDGTFTTHTPTEYAAAVQGEANMATSIAHVSETDTLHETVADELCYFLWMYWPQVQTAGSVRELHAWIEATELISCSQKLVEKVCRQVGLRLSPRGRRRHSDNRIPTD